MPDMMTFALRVILGFSEFSEFLFWTDGKTLHVCKIISSSTSRIFFKSSNPIEAIDRKSIDKNICIF